MLGRLVLCWYPKRKPSEEMRRTTGLWSLLRGRAMDLWKGWDFETWFSATTAFWEEEKKRKAKAEAAERAMQVMMRRDVKMKQLEMVLVEESESELLLLLWRSAIDWLGGSSWSSSGVGIALGFVSPEIIDSLFYLTNLVDVSYGKTQKVANFDQTECV